MKSKYANSALSGSRSAATFALQMLRDQERKLKLAERMYEAWERSGHTQEAVAQAIGLKHRSFQKALQTGGISYEKLERMAIFLDEDFDWLRTGYRKGETPDLSLSNPRAEQLDRIEEKVDEVLKRLPPPPTEPVETEGGDDGPDVPRFEPDQEQAAEDQGEDQTGEAH